MILMAIMLFNYIKNFLVDVKVFPFISLILTPIITMHIFTIEVKLAEVVKFQIEHLFQIITFDFMGVKSKARGK